MGNTIATEVLGVARRQGKVATSMELAVEKEFQADQNLAINKAVLPDADLPQVLAEGRATADDRRITVRVGCG
jgi:hypothetical protein